MITADLVRAARSAEQAGQIDRAAQLCRQALAQHPDCVEALLILGSIAARQGQIAEAETLLKKAHQADPASYDAARWLTTLLVGRQGGEEAVRFGTLAVSLRPDSAEAHVVLGLAALGQGNEDLAIQSFEKAIEIVPQMAGAYHNLGVALHRDESYREAIQAFQKALAINPKVPETHLHLGRTYLANNMPEEAMASAEKVLELTPNSGGALRLRADARFRSAIGERGEEHIRAAIEKDPKAGFPYALLGSRLQEQGNFDQAEEALRQSIRLQPNQGIAYYLFAHNRKMKEADRQLFQTIDSPNPAKTMDPAENRYLNFGLGKLYDDLGEYEKAIRHFDLANGDPAKAPPPNLHRQSRSRRIEALFTAEFIAEHEGNGLPDARPIFIVGMPRSGTTLLEQILSRHSQVGASGEQSFWRDAARRVFDLETGTLNGKNLQKAALRYLDLTNAIAPDHRSITDKFPGNFTVLGMLHLAFPNAILLHTRRHPVDTCLSIYMRPFSELQNAGQTRTRLVETYRQYQESMAHWHKVLPPGRILDVDYEQVVANTEEVARKVVAYCGLEWEDACLQPEKGDRRVVTFSKWQVRQPVYTTSVERWRRYEPWLGPFAELLNP